MGIEELKKKLGGGSFKNLLKTTTKQKKRRLISDVEFLNQEQYEFLEAHTQKHFFTFMEQYWGEKMTQAGITCHTFDGEVLNVEPGSIRVIDKRWKGASHCICGKAIRYEYWIQHYGPIGSVHIVEHTNLDKTLVRDITKGYKKQNEIRTEIVRMLADLKEENRTLEDWKEKFELEEKMKAIEFVRHKGKRELITNLVNLDLPLPESLRHELHRAVSFSKRRSSSPVEPTNKYQPLINDIDTALQAYKQGSHQGFTAYNMKVTLDLRRTLERGKPSPAQVDYANSLLKKLQDACQSGVSQNWLDAQERAKLILAAIVESDPSNTFATSLLVNSQKGSLTESQLDCIFSEEKRKRHRGLYYQYESLMKSKQIDPVDIESYRN